MALDALLPEVTAGKDGEDGEDGEDLDDLWWVQQQKWPNFIK